MPLLPFNASYLFLTPKRVRLPGEATKSPTPSPSPKKSIVRSSSMRWTGDLSVKARSFRSLVGGKTSHPPKGKEKDDSSI